MKTENLKELIKQMRGYAKTSELNTLLDNFTSFIDLANQKEQFKDDSGFQKEMEQTREKCFASIESALGSLGLTPEMMQEHFENPSNFSPDEWQKIQGLKEEYLGPTAPSNKRIKLHGRI